MKKFAKIMALVLVAVMAVAVLTACDGSWSDKPLEARQQVVDKGYVLTDFANYTEADGNGQIGYLIAKKSGSSQSVTLRIYFYDTPTNATIALEEMEPLLILERVSNLNGKLTYKVDGSKIVVRKTLKGLGALWG